jgi:hypothetical protein
MEAILPVPETCCFANRKLLILEHRKMAVPTFWKHVFVERGMLSLAGPDLAVP